MTLFGQAAPSTHSSLYKKAVITHYLTQPKPNLTFQSPPSSTTSTSALVYASATPDCTKTPGTTAAPKINKLSYKHHFNSLLIKSFFCKLANPKPIFPHVSDTMLLIKWVKKVTCSGFSLYLSYWSSESCNFNVKLS